MTDSAPQLNNPWLIPPSVYQFQYIERAPTKRELEAVEVLAEIDARAAVSISKALLVVWGLLIGIFPALIVIDIISDNMREAAWKRQEEARIQQVVQQIPQWDKTTKRNWIIYCDRTNWLGRSMDEGQICNAIKEVGFRKSPQ